MTGRRHTREDSGLVLDREGRWFHDGEPVEHPKVAEAFHRGLERTSEGRYLVRFGADWAYVRVEDAPLQIRAATVDPAGGEVLLTLSNGAREPLRPETLIAWQQVLYCTTAGAMPARFSRSAQAAVGDLLEPHPAGFALRLGGRSYPIVERQPERALPPPASRN